MTDIAGVSVANQKTQRGPGGVGVSGEKPAVQFQTVAGLNIKVLEGPAELGAGRNEGSVRTIYLAVLKPAEHTHGINEGTGRTRSGPADPSQLQALNMPHPFPGRE